jgi:hypothetical protein
MNPRMNPLRRHWLQTLAGGGLAALLYSRLAHAQTPLPGGMQRMRGAVTINGIPAKHAQAIQPGDSVATAADAEAIYLIGQDAFLQRGGTHVSFGERAAADFLRVLSGRLLSVFGSGEKRLAVGTATLGIRGTACYIEEEAARTYFCLCYGEVEVIPKVAPQQREIYRTTHHDHPIYIHADPRMPTSMVPADVINHSDAELTLLEALVGRVPPFQNAPDRRHY